MAKTEWVAQYATHLHQNFEQVKKRQFFSNSKKKKNEFSDFLF